MNEEQLWWAVFSILWSLLLINPMEKSQIQLSRQMSLTIVIIRMLVG